MWVCVFETAREKVRGRATARPKKTWSKKWHTGWKHRWRKNSVKTFHRFFSAIVFHIFVHKYIFRIQYHNYQVIEYFSNKIHFSFTVITRNYLFGAFFKFHFATLYLFLKGPLSDFSTCTGRCCKKIEATRKLRQLKPFAVKLKS